MNSRMQNVAQAASAVLGSISAANVVAISQAHLRNKRMAAALAVLFGLSLGVATATTIKGSMAADSSPATVRAQIEAEAKSKSIEAKAHLETSSQTGKTPVTSGGIETSAKSGNLSGSVIMGSGPTGHTAEGKLLYKNEAVTAEVKGTTQSGAQPGQSVSISIGVDLDHSIEATKMEAARAEATRMEAARVEATKMEAARAEAVRTEAARAEAAAKAPPSRRELPQGGQRGVHDFNIEKFERTTRTV